MQLEQKYLRWFVRYLLVAVAMVSVMPVLSLFTGPALAAPGVTIPDEHLRAVLETALGKSAGDPITETELADLTQLDVSGRSISELTGIELCTKVTLLPLDSNRISDISPCYP